VAAITAISTTQLIITIPPSLGGSAYPITVVTAGGTVVSAQTFTVVVPDPLGAASIKKIASGVDHACAILTDDSVWCWGGNGLGQLGNGTTASATVAVPVSGVTNAIDIAVGSSFSCAVVGTAQGAISGSVQCWGSGTSGQLGNGATSSSSTPVAVGSLSTATQVAARAGHACALLARGDVLCWGEGGSGQLGNGSSSSSAVPVAVIGTGADNYSIVDVSGNPASTKAFEVSAGDEHTCARISTSNGSDGLGVKCWGATNHGELGDGAPMCQVGVICDPKAPNPVPQRVAGVVSAARLAAGGHHTCVALTAGFAKCWGAGNQGQLGNGGLVHVSMPVNAALTGVTDVSAGSAFSCASASGALKCWGANDTGQLGNGLTANSPTPVAVTAIDAGTYAPDTVKGGDVETCMKRSDGTAFCFP
jgi:alpha-tubulin suppressor-like RCC1 family protein